MDPCPDNETWELCSVREPSPPGLVSPRGEPVESSEWWKTEIGQAMITGGNYDVAFES
jgi:hypothetical protein